MKQHLWQQNSKIRYSFERHAFDPDISLLLNLTTLHQPERDRNKIPTKGSLFQNNYFTKAKKFN
jgi:hypothetical protein